ncbi:hypothetical protein FGG08_003042 [Glutinoglossum americanum]|uniref:Uncharacterized protein n=1 Tax=Glutinoglossum americanum TaxID=1670608 RepID=A0A9P8L110_9PEZI|nr:hypothetical protein FGG08_003042 [Glutinoglossum americanum]
MVKLHLVVVVTALLCAHFAAAEWRPFRLWFPTYLKHYRYKWGDSCDALLNVSKKEDSWCESASDCILSNTPETQKANMAGAGILLGLAPSIIGNLAPTIESMAILATERPLLGFLVSGGTPAVFMARLFSVSDPLEPLSVAPFATYTKKRNTNTRIENVFVNLVEYGLAAASTANVIYTSYSISQRSIVSWSCPNWLWVICWSFTPAFAHILAVLIFRSTVRIVRPRQQKSHENGGWMDPNLLERFGGILWRREFMPCSERDLPQYEVRKDRFSRSARWVSPVISYIQLVAGTAILGSLLYIPFGDALPLVAKYVLSGVASRALVSFELTNLRKRNFDIIKRKEHLLVPVDSVQLVQFSGSDSGSR